ncbi:MAG: HAD-IA family hydrolase [Bacilli bacterium]
MIIAFDVDGTLLDTYEHIRATYIKVFNKYLPEYKYTEEEIKSFFGPPLPDTFNSIVHDDNLTEFLCDRYRDISKSIIKEYLKVYPGTHEVLNLLKKEGYKLAVVSNKQKSAILDGFKVVGLDNVFDLIIGYDSVVNPKPDPEGIRKIEKHYNDKCILVGDSLFDIETAKNANIKSIGVTFALTTKQQLLDVGADMVIDSFEELISAIKELEK